MGEESRRSLCGARLVVRPLLSVYALLAHSSARKKRFGSLSISPVSQHDLDSRASLRSCSALVLTSTYAV